MHNPNEAQEMIAALEEYLDAYLHASHGPPACDCDATIFVYKDGQWLEIGKLTLSLPSPENRQDSDSTI